MKALVIGGGIGGMSAAIGLRQQGVAVDLIDIDSQWRALGAGLTITGPTLRAFDRLGVLEPVTAEGYLSSEVKFFGGDGTFLHAMPTPVLEPGIPPAGGIMRPALHRIMADRVRALGCDVRLGTSAETLDDDDGQHVTVGFNDGETRVYDLVVASDGVASHTRSLLFPDAPAPQFTGQGCWRAVLRRPDDVTGAEVYFGPGYKVGINPCSPDAMYLFVTISMPGNPFLAEADLLEGLRDILAPIGGRIAGLREELTADSCVNYRPLDALLLPPPWHIGRIGMTGDAIHATTPHLASGAGMAVEDGYVLSECIAAAADVESAWQAFEARRWERCRLVVENSLLISRIEQEGGANQDIARLMAESVAALAEPM